MLVAVSVAQKAPGFFFKRLKMDNATRLFQKFFVLNFSQLNKAPLSWSVRDVFQVFVVVVVLSDPGVGVKIPSTQ